MLLLKDLLAPITFKVRTDDPFIIQSEQFPFVIEPFWTNDPYNVYSIVFICPPFIDIYPTIAYMPWYIYALVIQPYNLFYGLE